MTTRTTLTLFLLAVAGSMAACDDETVSGPGFVCDVTNPVRDLILNRGSATVLVHSPAQASDTVQLVAVATNRLGGARSDVRISFKSSDTNIATVDTLGVVHALQPGTAKITAEACGESSSATVTVIAGVQQVTVSPATDTVLTGDSALVVARAFAPGGAQVGNVVFTFSTSGGGVTIRQTSDSTAVYRGVSAGSFSITARGEGVNGTGTVLVLARNFLAGSVLASSLDAGDAMTCGIITTGRAFCWGLNNHGQLGAVADTVCFAGTDAGTIVNDSLVSTSVPCSLDPLRISNALDFSSISAGDSTACGISIAGRAYCWGMGIHGETGTGTVNDRSIPTLVTGALGFTTISVGGSHACGIATGGVAYCWGADSLGQLGDSRLVASTTPIPVVMDGGQASFASISAGYRHTCALKPDGTAYCWGSNEFGQLGDGTSTARDVPVLVAAGGLKFSAISAGGDHTCAITTGGAAYCWGSNVDGQLGRGTSNDISLVPVAVAGGLTFTRISASTGTRTRTQLGLPLKANGVGHTCALSTSGDVYCWGDDRDLQLGQGPFSGGGAIATLPVKVMQGDRAAGVTFTTISTGSRHSCAVGSDGAAYCWGSNVMGALGNTLQAAFRGLPQKVAAPTQ
jgi:alpha-tubulin suppressor-like RCC1 family protein